MDIIINQNPFLVFDLDDTLYPEISFLKSAYHFISIQLEPILKKNIAHEMIAKFKEGSNVFAWILETYPVIESKGFDRGHLLHLYRSHFPSIQLYDDVAAFLKLIAEKGISAGLITDGRSLTQRNKLKSLGLENYFSSIVISEEFGSEKPCENNFVHFEKLYPGKRFFYFGDNTKKDFIAPLQLGWKCVCLENRGENIHNQSFVNMNQSIILLKKFNQILVS